MNQNLGLIGNMNFIFFSYLLQMENFPCLEGKIPYICEMNMTAKEIYKDIPAQVDAYKTLELVKSGYKTSGFIIMLKSLTNENDQKISDWLSISIKTFRSYRNTPKKNTRYALSEHLIMLISLFKHGKDVFGTTDKFDEWLNKENFFFGKQAPKEFLNTISGIKFVDDRLTGMQYGDNA